MNKSFDALKQSSSSLMDYRARLCYISIAHKHPKWDRSIVRALAELKALFVTIFQRPLEHMKERKVRRILRSKTGSR